MFLLPMILLFICGLVIGSFLNVVAFRYTPEKSLFCLKNLGGRSKCRQCSKKLKWYELIPLVSFVIQKRRCRSCFTKLSWQYFFVELASGLIFLLPFYFYNPLLPFVYWVASSALWVSIFLMLLLIWVIDYRICIIPDEINIILGILGVALTWVKYGFYEFSHFTGSFLYGYANVFGLRENIWINMFAGLAFSILSIGAVIIFTKGRGMGMGDLKLMAALGLIFAWPDIVFILVFACIIGSLFSIYFLTSKKHTLKSAVPFAPFIMMGVLTVVFFGEPLIGAYFRFFNL